LAYKKTILRKKNFCEQKYSTEKFNKNVFFLTMVDLYTKMCRIELQSTFRNNVGVLDRPKKVILEKMYLLKNSNLRKSHKK